MPKPKPKPKVPSRAAPPRKPAAPAKSTAAPATSASRLIDQRIRSLGDWRGATLARLRTLVLEADPGITEEVKWVKPSNPSGVPVWSRAGIVCTGESYAKVVKLTFARGASLPDPSRLFNASLEGGTRRAIDLREGETIDPAAFQALVRAAVAANLGAKAGPGAKQPVPPRAKAGPGAKQPVLLSGGNPQIAKGDGDAPVQAYLSAMPGWKRELGRRLDALVTGEVPQLRKAVKWNSPFYGVEGRGWFLSFHVFTRYVKVTFFRGASLTPLPPGGTAKSQEARWLDLHEGDELDEAQLASWVEQAAALPGWAP